MRMRVLSFGYLNTYGLFDALGVLALLEAEEKGSIHMDSLQLCTPSAQSFTGTSDRNRPNCLKCQASRTQCRWRRGGLDLEVTGSGNLLSGYDS